MEQFARTVIAYHGCRADFANGVLLGDIAIEDWQPSQNEWDWLGHGIYFWEHSPGRAMRWARDKYSDPAVLGAVLQIGRCFDLLDEAVTALLTEAHARLVQAFLLAQQPLPTNAGAAGKLRRLDCLVINDCLSNLAQKHIQYDTVRGAFLEGEPVYLGAGFNRETHIQIAVRNPACVIGTFRPNFTI